jgi:hypothetical protein
MGNSSSIDINNGINFVNNINTNGTGSSSLSISQLGEFTLYNTTSSLNLTTGALISYSGINIYSTSNSVDITQGNALTVRGGLAMRGDMNNSGRVQIGFNTSATLNTTAPLNITAYPFGIFTTETSYNLLTGTWIGSAGSIRSFSVNKASNNDIVFNMNNALDIRTNSVSRLFMEGSFGNINIGTTTPATNSSVLMNIVGSNGSTEMNIQSNTTSAHLRLGICNTSGPFVPGAAFLASNNSGPIQIGTFTSGTVARSVFIYTSTGNAGIGTVTPTFNLDVTNIGTVNFTTSLSTANMYSSNMSVSNMVATFNSTNNTIITNLTLANLLSTSMNVSTVNTIITGITASNINILSNLYQNGSIYSGSDVWGSGTGGNLFYTSGNVGINTTAPTFTLDVRGTNGVSVQTGITCNTLSISTLGNILITNNINTYGNMIFNTSGSVVVSNLKGINNRLRTSRANANNAVSTWTSRTSAADNGWRSIVWSPELSLFVAVSDTGTGNRVMTSPDGIIWTTRTSAANNSWYSIAWSPELSLFVAVAITGTGNRVMTSPNGLTWTTRTSAADNDWWGVTWSSELSLFVAVATTGTGNRVMTSPDGLTWTTRTSAADNQWLSVTWSAELGLFAAVAVTGTNDMVMTSPNGINWTTRRNAVTSSWWNITWSPELSIFAAVSSGGANNRVMTSPDGINWTSRTTAALQWSSISWSPELSLFVAVAMGKINYGVMTSHNGITWTTRTSAADNYWRSVVWSAELSRFVTVADTGTGNRVMTSTITLPNSKSTPLVSPAHMTCDTSTGNVTITGALSKGSGTFDISHPLDSSKRLVHSFIEGPRCDLIYRGTTQLQNGTAVVTIDSDCVAESNCAMTQGTFESLTTNPVINLQNYTSFDRVRGILSGNTLTILCENQMSSDTIHWYVMAERKDPFIKSWDRTNENGYLITEK